MRVVEEVTRHGIEVHALGLTYIARDGALDGQALGGGPRVGAALLRLRRRNDYCSNQAQGKDLDCT